MMVAEHLKIGGAWKDCTYCSRLVRRLAEEGELLRATRVKAIVDGFNISQIW